MLCSLRCTLGVAIKSQQRQFLMTLTEEWNNTLCICYWSPPYQSGHGRHERNYKQNEGKHPLVCTCEYYVMFTCGSTNPIIEQHYGHVCAHWGINLGRVTITSQRYQILLTLMKEWNNTALHLPLIPTLSKWP